METGISSGLMGYLARMQTLPYLTLEAIVLLVTALLPLPSNFIPYVLAKEC